MTTPHLKIVKDIRAFADSIDRLWKRNRIPWGVWSDAQHFEDFAALHRVVKWSLNHPWTMGTRAYQVAARLDAALHGLSPVAEAEVRLQLRIAALCVTVQLRQAADGSWTQTIKDLAA